MSAPTLVIGNKAYSSWSLRPWLAMRVAGLPFEEKLVRLSEPGSREALLSYSPAGRVPVLKHDGRTIWESLAILEYLAELAPDAGLWPADPEARALARSVSAEMHAGFQTLRGAMPMNLRRHLPGRGRDLPGVADDVRRITEIWRDCRQRFGDGGPFLFGAFGNADAMFAPVVTRFRTYAVELDPVSQAYADAVLALSAFLAWQEAADAEPWIIEEDEVA